jgi:hypothetical protein
VGTELIALVKVGGKGALRRRASPHLCLNAL